MNPEFTLQTRRAFLRRTVLAGALTWTVPSFLANTFSVLQAEAADRATQAVTGRDSTILVILQMAGGNDGINTVIPHGSDFYYRARTRIGIPADHVLKLNQQVGFHPSLTGFKALYDQGHLAVVQGVGYPNPNRSHFRSTEIWQTASDSNKVENHGWLGRYFDNTCPGCDPTIGVNIGRQMPEAFAGKVPKCISLENPRNYRFISSDHRGRGQSEDMMERSYRELNEPDGYEAGDSGATIASLRGHARRPESAMDFLERTALDAQLSSDEIRTVAGRTQNHASYPASELGHALMLVAKLIGGGLPTRVFYVSQGGYDTHTNQAATHARLLKDLGDSVKAFCDDMKFQGNLGRVLVMTFSEFGRRVSDNASGGTDHGAAAPLFIVGNRVKAGLLGRYPSLAPADLFEGDLVHTVDFRSVYAAVLENWLRTKSVPVLGRRFEPLPLV